MKVYLYCSYTGSPVGFVMGVTERLSVGKWSPLNMNGIPKDIRGCFEHAIVRNAAGNFVLHKSESAPDDRWIILLKNITYRLPESEDNITYYINIAFETTDKSEYEKWIAPTEEDKLGERVASCLDITKSSDFGYALKEENLSELANSPLSALPQKISDQSLENCCIEFIPNLPKTEREIFIHDYAEGLWPCDLENITEYAGWCFVKKKLMTTRRFKYGVAAGLAVIILLGLWMMTPKEKKKHPTSPVAEISLEDSQKEQIKKNLKNLSSENRHLKILDALVLLESAKESLSAILLVNENQLNNRLLDYLNDNAMKKVIKRSDPADMYDENIKNPGENVFHGELLLTGLNQKLPIFIPAGRNNFLKEDQVNVYEMQCKVE